jgi:hypothetical protein
MQMNNGKYGPEKNKQLFSEKEHDEMWHYKLLSQPDQSAIQYSFQRLRLSWFVSDVKGFKQAHTGGLEGIVTQTTYIPEFNLNYCTY